MKELSLNILDITENSTNAKADLIFITIEETDETLTLTVSDNGTGMTKEFLKDVTNPFTTTRTTRNVGLGIPLLKLQAQQTGGDVEITSKYYKDFPDSHGTTTKALFYKNHIDMTPLGDVISTITTLIQGHDDIDFVFSHKMPDNEVLLDTRQMREILGDVKLSTPEVLVFIKEYLTEQYGQK